MAQRISNVTYDCSLSERRDRLRHIERQLRAAKKGKRPRGRPKKELPPSSYSRLEQHRILDCLYEMQKAGKGKRGVHIVIYRQVKHHNARDYLKIEARLIRTLKGFEPKRLTWAQYLAMKILDLMDEYVEVLHVNDREIFPPERWIPNVRMQGFHQARKLTETPRAKREACRRYRQSLGITEPCRRRQKLLGKLSRSALYRRQREERQVLLLPPLPRRGQRVANPKPSTIARRDRLVRQRLGLSRPTGRQRAENPKPATLKARQHYPSRRRRENQTKIVAANQ